jgi:hypothetical protein
MELCMVAGRRQTRVGRPHAVSGRLVPIHTYHALMPIHTYHALMPIHTYHALMPIHTYHAVPLPRCAMSLISIFQNGMAWERHRRIMARVNQTWPHCVNQMGKTQSKPLAAQHGRGMAWERHDMCELALRQMKKLQRMDLECVLCNGVYLCSTVKEVRTKCVTIICRCIWEV